MNNLIFDEESKRQMAKFAREMKGKWIGSEIKGLYEGTVSSRAIEQGFDNPLKDVKTNISDALNGETNINTFPFGNPTKDTFPEWLGIYEEGNREHSFRRLLQSVVRYCRTPNTVGTTKTIFILTDTWNTRIETAIIRHLLPFYKKKLSRVFIFLYNDFGITAVPFFMSFGWDLKLNYMDRLEIEEQIYENPVTFNYKHYSTWDNRKTEVTRNCQIDLKGKYYAENGKAKTLTEEQIRRFVITISRFSKEIMEYKPRELARVLDDVTTVRMEIMNKTIVYNSDETHLERRIKKAFLELLDGREFRVY